MRKSSAGILAASVIIARKMDVWNGENLEMIFGCSTVPWTSTLFDFQQKFHGSWRNFLAGHWAVEVQSRALKSSVDRVDPAENHVKMLLFF